MNSRIHPHRGTKWQLALFAVGNEGFQERVRLEWEKSKPAWGHPQPFEDARFCNVQDVEMGNLEGEFEGLPMVAMGVHCLRPACQLDWGMETLKKLRESTSQQLVEEEGNALWALAVVEVGVDAEGKEVYLDPEPLTQAFLGWSGPLSKESVGTYVNQGEILKSVADLARQDASLLPGDPRFLSQLAQKVFEKGHRKAWEFGAGLWLKSHRAKALDEAWRPHSEATRRHRL